MGAGQIENGFLMFHRKREDRRQNHRGFPGAGRWMRVFNHLNSLPASIGNLKSLTRLSLAMNTFFSYPYCIIEWLKGLKKQGCDILIDIKY
jgi:hypothetical protein